MIALTNQQYRIARLVAQGMTLQEVSKSAGCCYQTIKTHLFKIRRRLNVKTNVAVANWYWNRCQKHPNDPAVNQDAQNSSSAANASAMHG